MSTKLTRKQKKIIIELLKHFVKNPYSIRWSYKRDYNSDRALAEYNGTQLGISRVIYNTSTRYKIDINDVKVLDEECYFYHSKIAKLARKIINTQAEKAGGSPEVIKTNNIEKAINEAREKYLIEKLSGI